MLKNLFKNYIYPAVVFAGGMVGVGFLSLPYIAGKVGIWVMLVYFVVLTGIVLLLNLIFCKISLKTPDYKRLPGFAKYHLGKWGGALAMVLTVVGAVGSLLIFLIVGSEFLSDVFSPIVGGGVLLYTFIYFIVASLVVFLGIKIISRAEFWILAFLVLSLILIFAGGFSSFKIANIFVSDFGFRASNLFLPYGAIIFALWAVGIIPEVEEMLEGRKSLLKPSIILSTVGVSVFYFLFVLLVLGITGSGTTEIALIGLQNFLGPGLVGASLIAGALATFAAFITQGIILKKVFIYDLGLKHWQAFVMTCFTPLILLLLGFNSFIPLISFFGAVLFGIFGIMILLMYKKIGGKKIVIYPLFLIFLLGVVYEIFYFIK